jgi:quinoprotein dehydrogenase-associated probable ABC transporter substrate-binding protein
LAGEPRPALAGRALAGLALAGLALADLVLGGAAPARAQQVPDLVTPDVLRVCADPANTPFSNRKGEGFENRIAAIVAEELKVPVRYYWLPQGPGFVRNTLGTKLCDVIMGYAAGTELVQHSNPYYRTVYTMLVKRGGDLEGVAQLSDPRLKEKRIGVVAATPPVDHLAELGLLERTRSYALMVDRRYDSPADQMYADLMAGEIDAAILWGPNAGSLAARAAGALAMIPLVKEAARPALSYRITLGMRPNELEWRRSLNTVLRRRQADIHRVLIEANVPVLTEDDRLMTLADLPGGAGAAGQVGGGPKP